MEEEQLAAQRQTYLRCPIVAFVIDALAGLVECKTKDKGTEVVKSRRANKGSK